MQNRLDPLDHRQRTRLSRAGRQLDHHLQLTLILGRQKAAGHLPVKQPADADQHRIHDEHPPDPLHGAGGEPAIAARRAIETFRKSRRATREEAAQAAAGLALMRRRAGRLQQVGAQRRA